VRLDPLGKGIWCDRGQCVLVARDPRFVRIGNGEATAREVTVIKSKNDVLITDSDGSIDPDDLNQALDIMVSVTPGRIAEIDGDYVVFDLEQTARSMTFPGTAICLDVMHGVTGQVQLGLPPSRLTL